MGSDIATRQRPDMARIILDGDLSKLTDDQRLQHNIQLCKRLGIDYSTRPFEYLVLNKKLVLYAKKDCTDQLRMVHQISLGKPEITVDNQRNVVTVWVEASFPEGRKDGGIGACSLMKREKDEDSGVYMDKPAPADDVANAIMKAETKAKRRATLSLCGLGCLDESELETTKGVGSIGPCSKEQYNEINDLLKKTGANLNAWLDKFDVKLMSELNQVQAGEVIAALKESLKLQSL